MIRLALILALLLAASVTTRTAAEEKTARGEASPAAQNDEAAEESATLDDEDVSSADSDESTKDSGDKKAETTEEQRRVPDRIRRSFLRSDSPASLKVREGAIEPRGSTETKSTTGPRERGPRRSPVAPCGQPAPPAGEHPFVPGETLLYDLDIMGMRAGTLTLTVDPPTGGGSSFSASTRTNTFFASIREVEGRARTFTDTEGLRPIRYREDSTEDGVRKWAEVLFPKGRNEVDVRFGIGQRERRVRYPVTDTPLDILTVVYYLRTINLSVGDELCLDVYANRRVWRVSGSVEAEEFVRTPAGGFETLRLSGTAKRMDRPSIERELHLWFSKDEQQTPVAAMSVIDLGPVRARLSRLGSPSQQTQEPERGGGRW